MSKATRSESLFEQFLQLHGLHFERVPEEAEARPDYLVSVNEAKIALEIKELTRDEDFTRTPFAVSSRKVGDHIRAKIGKSRKQLQVGAKKGIPSILLVYNGLDPLQTFGTEPHDFRAAMYGDWTLDFTPNTLTVHDAYHGRNASYKVDRNTSFGAVGLLHGRLGNLGVTLHENLHAVVPVPFASLPACFEIIRYEMGIWER